MSLLTVTWKAVVDWSVGFVLGILVGAHGLRGVVKAWRRHMSVQEDIADKLDPYTPSGIKVVVDELQEANRTLSERRRP